MPSRRWSLPRGARAPSKTLGWTGELEVLVDVEDLLEELLAGAQAGEADLDVLARGEAREADHVAGQVDDLDRLAHVQDEDLAVAAQDAGLEHQLAGLGDGHEVAGHVRVGDRDRAAPLDLAP